MVLDDATTVLENLLQPLLVGVQPIAPDLNNTGDVPLANVPALVSATPAQDARSPVMRPGWAETEFSALRFGWEDLEVAVPLAALECVIAVPGRLSRLPGQPDSQLGVVTVRGHRRVVVDLRYRIGLRNSVGAAARLTASGFVLTLAEGRYAVHCTQLGSAERLGPADVKWRRATGAVPWVAAVLNDGLCLLLDTSWLCEKFRHD